MISQAIRTGEASVAELALIRLVTSMTQLMPLQMVVTSECTLAYGAFKAFLVRILHDPQDRGALEVDWTGRECPIEDGLYWMWVGLPPR